METVLWQIRRGRRVLNFEREGSKGRVEKHLNTLRVMLERPDLQFITTITTNNRRDIFGTVHPSKYIL
jgi:hypothetical protein